MNQLLALKQHYFQKTKTALLNFKSAVIKNWPSFKAFVIKWSVKVLDWLICLVVTLYHFSRWLVINGFLVGKYMIFALGRILRDVFFGAIDALYDQSIKHKRSTQDNIGRLLASLIVLVALAMITAIVSSNTVKQVSYAFENPTISKTQRDQTTYHIKELTPPSTPWKKAAATKTVLPNHDYMPAGIHYIKVKALKDSPLAKHQLTSSQYQNDQLTIVDKLFTNPVNADEVFINKIAQGAQIAALSYGVNPSVLIAQAYVESGQGTSQLAVKYNNYFGIKYRGYGQKVTMPTKEQTSDGQEYTINADFQVYTNLADSMAGNASLLRNGISGDPKHYQGTWVENTKSYTDATQDLTQRYATAVDYNQILNKFIQTYGLYVLDSHPVHNPDLSKAD